MLDWIAEIDPQLSQLEERPQFKRVREFPLESLEKHLQQLLQDPSVRLEVKPIGWRLTHSVDSMQKEEYGILLAPLQEPIFVTVDGNELARLLIDKPDLIPEEMKEGFVSYFFTEAMHLVTTTEAMRPLTLRFLGQKRVSEEHCFQIDVKIMGTRGEMWLTFFLTPAFRKQWNDFFKNEPSLPIPAAQQESIHLELGVQIGNVNLSLKELEKIKRGDFLLIRNCSYDPETQQGRALLTLKNRALFRGEIAAGEFTIVDLPPYEEVFGMDKDDVEEDEEELEEEEEDEFDDDDEEEEDFAFSEEESVSPADEVEKEPPVVEEPLQEQKDGTQEVLLNEVEVQVVVEICRIHLSVKEVLDLSEGNIIDLHVASDKEVDLMVQGKRFGKGELVRIGDLLGVRISHLAGK